MAIYLVILSSNNSQSITLFDRYINHEYANCYRLSLTSWIIDSQDEIVKIEESIRLSPRIGSSFCFAGSSYTTIDITSCPKLIGDQGANQWFITRTSLNSISIDNDH